MKVILSRKGFDSEYGGYPSPILPDSRLVSLPIPTKDAVRYYDLKLDESTSYFDLMKQLRPEIKADSKWELLTQNTRCHLDPDIYRDVQLRKAGWKPCFGQIDKSQKHLETRVNIGDVFLFFGWFRRTTQVKGRFVFDNRSQNMHVIFGYLQIGEKITLNSDFKVSDWMKSHPHTSPERKSNPTNTIYVARENLSWNKNLPGAGAFNFHDALVLTKKGFSRSRWDLPLFFKEAEISYHSKNSWKDGYFQSAARGQEFVVKENNNVELWAMRLINDYAR